MAINTYVNDATKNSSTSFWFTSELASTVGAEDGGIGRLVFDFDIHSFLSFNAAF